MLAIENSPIAWLNRQYLDLGPLNGGRAHHHGIEFSYNALANNTPLTCGIQVNVSPLFRESLVTETGMYQYQVSNPLELPEELQTDRWRKLCEYLSHYHELPDLIKLRVMNLLRSLCFHQAVLEYIPEISASEISKNPELAALAWCRTLCSFITHFDNNTYDYLNDIELVANNAPSGSRIKVNAALQLVVEYTKYFGDIQSGEFWREVASKEIQLLKPSLNDFEYNVLMSNYYRSVSFIPFVHKDKEKVIEEMNLCEFHGRNIVCENHIQEVVAREVLCLLTESRSKEAIWLGDLDLAEERVRLIVELEPLETRYHLELAEILLKKGKIEDAANVYHSATKLGPPGTPVAWFMAGQCHEQLGELEVAGNCYLTSLQIDPQAISVMERLFNLALRLDNPALTTWSQLRLTELKEQQKRMIPKPRPSYQSDSISLLKRAGDKVLVQI
jgi:tetratricopeptide (TPR) repeat protein